MFQYIGTARCSEQEPQCTEVRADGLGNILLSNESGTITIPAGEWTEVLNLLSR